MLQNYHQQQMEDVGAIRLSGAPLPELAVPIAIFAEQPEQSKADEDTQKRFVDAKPGSPPTNGGLASARGLPPPLSCELMQRVANQYD